MISAFVISALYLLGAKLFYEYTQEISFQDGEEAAKTPVVFVVAWPLVIAAALVLQAIDKDTDE